MMKLLQLVVTCLALTIPVTTLFAEDPTHTVVIYGATPAGIAAALSAADDGAQVVLIEPTNRIGGLVTNGLSHTDFHSLQSLTGAFWDFAQRVEGYYVKTYGENSPQHEACFHGTFGEPKVNLMVFEQMLAERPTISLLKQVRLRGVQTSVGQRDQSLRIDSIRLGDQEKTLLGLKADVYIDATHEGDLMAMAKVPWRVGREGREEYGESLAPDTGDNQLQAYNFRWTMTQDEDNRILPQAPQGYQREDFVGVLGHLNSGAIEKIFDYPSKCIFKAQTPLLPNGKCDINDVSRGVVRLSLPGKNLGWPDGDLATRQKIFEEHVRDQVGLLYFLQNDDAVPEKFHDEARTWGFCKDEFQETNHFPDQLYVREARRMMGQHVYTQQDSECAPGDARAVFHATSIASGDYGNNCHGTFHEGSRFGGKHSGEFYNPVPAYQIPYGVLVPKDVDNLLVCGAVSSSHVGFCALRLEPIWMSLGQAAGHAATQAGKLKKPVQEIDVPSLQRRLHKAGSATIYVTDVRPGDPDFEAVQWWGSLGGLHGLEPTPKSPRGKKLHGQYCEAFPGHEVKLDEPLTEDVKARWMEILKGAGLTISADIKTRGDLIRAGWAAQR